MPPFFSSLDSPPPVHVVTNSTLNPLLAVHTHSHTHLYYLYYNDSQGGTPLTTFLKMRNDVSQKPSSMILKPLLVFSFINSCMQVSFFLTQSGRQGWVRSSSSSAFIVTFLLSPCSLQSLIVISSMFVFLSKSYSLPLTT
ncbi:hypothetical protein ATANTOWER_012326 [Ataeniobius toweri]|uniref:Uncharacterized protein n=1 Tax=Ataeniobius toweri TaxID=208326 RepID=A0ABU7AQY8_9TELE|nr:hypothetical protein [Ataeniobius toweri]